MYLFYDYLKSGDVMFGTKGQGSGAATLVAIITLLIVLYILFIPPESREELLGLNSSSTSTSSSSSTSSYVHYNKTLSLSCEGVPGRVDYLSQKEIEHNIAVTTVMTKTSASIIKDVGAIYVKDALFSSKEENVSFGINDVGNTKNILLSFVVKKAGGRLIISLNDNEIFNSEVVGENVEPIVLPREFLMGKNVLVFKTSNPGLVFWRTNEFVLEGVKVTADITDVDARESNNVFLVGSSEKNNLDKSSIRFIVDKCGSEDSGRLYVTLNGFDIFKGIPDLNTPLKFEFDGGRLFSGENTLGFRVDSGCYLLDRIVLTSTLKEAFQPFCSFDLSDSEYNDITAGRENVNLSIKFGISTDSQGVQIINEGSVLVNNNARSFYTRGLSQGWIINSYVERGSNTIKIVPKNKMDINKVEATIY